MADRTPRAYLNDVPKEGTDPVMEYVDFPVLGIGARKSGQPTGVDAGRKMNLDHVGGTAGGKRGG